MDYKVTDTELTSVANAIRTKGGTSALLEWPDEFVQAVADLPTGGGSISVADVVDIINNFKDYFLVPFYTSATNPTGYSLSYSSQRANTVPAWAVFNSTIQAVTNGTIADVRWTASEARPQWVQIELPEAQKINCFYISNVIDSVSFCKTYKVQGSNDNTTFTDLFEETIENTPISKVVALSEESEAYKYYRVVVTDSYDDTYSGLTSFFPMYIDVQEGA